MLLKGAAAWLFVNRNEVIVWFLSFSSEHFYSIQNSQGG